jgi:hypothetical protein
MLQRSMINYIGIGMLNQFTVHGKYGVAVGQHYYRNQAGYNDKQCN